MLKVSISVEGAAGDLGTGQIQELSCNFLQKGVLLHFRTQNG